METVLLLLKQDFGIKSDNRDVYFTSLLKAAEKELKRKGITLNLDSTDDQVLLADYTAWNYRNRQKDIGLSKNLQVRIRNRIIKERATRDN